MPIITITVILNLN